MAAVGWGRASVLALGTTLLTSAAWAEQPAPADPAPSQEGLQEIVVTALRRADNLQKVPVSVTALTAADLQARGIINTLTLGQFVPNLVATPVSGIASGNVYFLRGLGSAETIATVDPPVGTYVDEVFIARTNANAFGLFDVERTEVLRGPQGTLFGRNTTGGAINIVLRKPSDKLTGFGEASYGAFNRVFLRGSVDVPMSDKVLTKVSGYFNTDDGWLPNVTIGERLNASRWWGVRGAVRVLATESLIWDGAVSYQEDTSLNVLGFACDIFDPGRPNPCRSRYATSGLRQRPLNNEPPLTNLVINVPGLGPQPTTLANGKGNIPFGTTTGNTVVTSSFAWSRSEAFNVDVITGYIFYDQRYLLDQADGRASRAIGNFNPPVLRARNGGNSNLTAIVGGEQVTQEVKVNGRVLDGTLGYVGGVYYIYERNRTDFADILGTISTLTADRTLTNTAEAIAGYLQLDYAPARWITATAGVRYTDEVKSFTIVDQRDPRVDTLIAPAPGAAPVSTRLNTANAAAFGIPMRLHTSIWTPRFALQLFPTDRIQLFASATNGFRSGAWAGRAQRIDQFFSVRPEIVWSYEAGFKSEWFNRRLRANVTFFQVDTTDAQLPSAFIDPRTNGTVFTTLNDGDVRNRGIEAELQASPVAGLNLYLNAATQDAGFRNIRPGTLARQAQCRAAIAGGGLGAGICGTGVINAQGNIATPPRTPELTLQAGGSYDWKIGRSIISPSLNFLYSTSYETLTANVTFFRDANGVINTAGNGAYIGGSRTPGYLLTNAILAWRLPGDRVRLQLQCDNCFDEKFVLSGLNGYAFLNPPATWLVTARYSF